MLEENQIMIKIIKKIREVKWKIEDNRLNN